MEKEKHEPIRRSARTIDQLPMSPNLQTRTRRKQSGVSVENSFTERQRVAKVCRDFKHRATKPCSVFGSDRHARYRGGFFFCFNCRDADDYEKAFPNTPINRLSDSFKCTASHTSILYPTDRITIEDRKKMAAKKAHEASTTDQSGQVATTNTDPTQSADSKVPRKKKRRASLTSRKKSKVKQPPNERRSLKAPPPTATSIHEDAQADTSTQTTGPATNNENTSIDEDLQVVQTAKNGIESEFEVDIEDLEVVTAISFNDVSTQTDPINLPSNPPTPSVQEYDNHNQSDGVPPPTTTDSSTQTTESRSTVVTSEGVHLATISRLQTQLSKEAAQNDRLRRLLREERKKSRARYGQVRHLQQMVNRKRNPVTINMVPTTCSNRDNADAIVEHIKQTISQCVSGHNEDSHRAVTFFNLLANMLMYEGIHYDQLRDSIVKVVGRYLRQNVFSPHNILREMDLTGGKLSYAGIEVLRLCETGGRKGVHTILPSSAAMREYAAKVEEFADQLVPYRMIRNKRDGSEGFYFRSADTLTRVLETRDMIVGEALEEEKTVSMSLDGARMSNNQSHTLGGFKFNDPSNPLKQSLHAVYPVVCTIGPETKKHSQGIYAMMHAENKEAAEKVLPSEFGIKKVRTPFDSDMSCDWKLSDRGGAAKNATYPCSKCNIMSSQLVTPNGDNKDCKWCIELDHLSNEEWNCYHRPICTDEFVAEKENEIDAFKAEMPAISAELKDIWAKSKIKINQEDDPRLCEPTDLDDLSSIHFDCESASEQEKQQYSTKLSDDLKLRNMDVDGSVEDKQERLKRQLTREWMYLDAFDCVQKFDSALLTTAIVMVMDAIPCILHMEMRMGIRIITLLMKVGLTNAKSNQLPWITRSQRSSMKKKCDAFRKKINTTINTVILGTTNVAFQFELPFDEASKSIEECNMKNGYVRKVIAAIDCLIDLCVVNTVDKERWKTCMREYSAGMEIVKKKEDLSQVQINAFQRHIDLWFQDWVTLFGDQGVTNYAHYLGAGHIAEYLQHWKNISSHSQQGWEAFNSAFKTYYFNRTQRGGAVSQGNGERSRLKPMARWLQRRMVFMLNHTENSIDKGLRDYDDEQEEWLKTWVSRNGGTIEFGQKIGTGDTSNETNGSELLLDWQLGPKSRDLPTSLEDDSIHSDDQSC